MTVEENVQVVKNAYAAFGRGDIQGLLGMLSDDVEWIIPGEGLIMSGSYRGHDGVGRFFQNLSQVADLTKFEPREFMAQGDNVAVIGWEQGRMKSTDRTFAVDWVMVFTVRGGKIAKFREFTDTQSLAAAQAPSAKAAS